jgi:hypothetical protein
MTLRQAAREHPNEALTQYLLAEALMADGKEEGTPEFKEEGAAAERVVRLDPTIVSAYDLLGDVHYDSGHFDLAVKTLSDGAGSRSPNTSRLFIISFLPFERQGKLKEFQRA